MALYSTWLYGILNKTFIIFFMQFFLRYGLPISVFQDSFKYYFVVKSENIKKVWIANIKATKKIAGKDKTQSTIAMGYDARVYPKDPSFLANINIQAISIINSIKRVVIRKR